MYKLLDVASKRCRVLAVQLEPHDAGLHGTELSRNQHQMRPARAARRPARLATTTVSSAVSTAVSTAVSASTLATAIFVL